MRHVLFLLLAVAAVVAVVAYNRDRGAETFRDDFIGIIRYNEFAAEEERYLTGLVDRHHVAVITESGASGERIDAAWYVEHMFDRLIEAARADGRPDELLARLEQVKIDNVAANRP
ncbi:MAG: hypothetical protein C4547_01755 [Phycisphaerales bacterium]|nr:MAG: hypothetical protein C4547_01755 [Phycisphaerales bacterium]